MIISGQEEVLSGEKDFYIVCLDMKRKGVTEDRTGSASGGGATGELDR